MFGLHDNTVSTIISMLRKHSAIEKAVVYGSRAKGNYRPGSDIDLALFGQLGAGTIAEILDELDESYLPYTFDVLAYDSLKTESLREHIDRVGLVLYTRVSGEDARNDLNVAESC